MQLLGIKAFLGKLPQCLLDVSHPATVNKTLWPARTRWMPPVATARYGPVIQDTSNGGAAPTIARCNKQQR